MLLQYRTQRNAEAAATYWGKPLDRPDWWRIEAKGDEGAEILIYDVIGWPFNDARELVRALTDLGDGPVTVRINSPGGDVFDAFALFNAIQSHRGKTTTRVEAQAASAASLLAMAGSTRQAYKNSMLMIHDPWVLTVGNQYELREVADVLEKIAGNMVDLYAAASRVGKREVQAMMKAETWLTAKEAAEKGFVDTLLDGKSAKAQFDLSMYANAPHASRGRTEREAERTLRDAGWSRTEAKAVLAGCQPEPEAAGAVDELAAILTKIRATMEV